ncbi:MAG: hypothetical protein AB1779_06955 [Candidatus Thermoplasmatota archaeon]
MRTYLKIIVHSEGAKPSEIAKKLKYIGFEPVVGNYDFCLNWKKDVDADNALRFADTVHDTLKGCNVQFTIQTL